MKKSNNKGFTLVELIATIVILALVASIGSYAIVNLINKSKEENKLLLYKEIESASELYYQECKYMKPDKSGMDCDMKVPLGYLVEWGYLKGNSTNNGLVDPTNENIDISNCNISISYTNSKINIEIEGVKFDEQNKIPSYSACEKK